MESNLNSTTPSPACGRFTNLWLASSFAFTFGSGKFVPPLLARRGVLKKTSLITYHPCPTSGWQACALCLITLHSCPVPRALCLVPHPSSLFPLPLPSAGLPTVGRQARASCLIALHSCPTSGWQACASCLLPPLPPTTCTNHPFTIHNI